MSAIASPYVLVLVVALLAVSAGAPAAVEQHRPNPCVGTITDEPGGTTLLTIQGARGGEKTPSLLVGVAPDGTVRAVYNASDRGRWWLYDIDPLSNGNLLVAETEPGISVASEVDPHTGELVSVRRFRNVLDAHDVDLLDGELLLVDKGEERDRVLAYNLSREAVTWEWRFTEHPDAYPKAGGGPYPTDWTHVNDVDRIDDGLYMVSVRNFDQVVAINRSTDGIEWTLGEDGNHDLLFRQHNPQYLEGQDGRPTVLVADSRNDRVVEYAREGDEWVRTWVLRGGGLDEPRDADRLPNGNTLVADRHGHRFLEVTPTGEVVWEFYGPWQPYDVERYRLGDEPGGPTARELNAAGSYELTGSAGFDTAEIEACAAFLNDYGVDSGLVGPNETVRDRVDRGVTITAQDAGTNESALGTSRRWLFRPEVLGAGVFVALVALVLLARRFA